MAPTISSLILARIDKGEILRKFEILLSDAFTDAQSLNGLNSAVVLPVTRQVEEHAPSFRGRKQKM
ncbi:MAG: hypothetical protein JO081_10830 [Alphaproteobacteria bacterium]|nr:hypothetical protein [Alphaproteobacteria bacterium]